MACEGPVFFISILGTEYWTGWAPRIGRGSGAADWTGFGSGSGWLLGLWVSVFGSTVVFWRLGFGLRIRCC